MFALFVGYHWHCFQYFHTVISVAIAVIMISRFTEMNPEAVTETDTSKIAINIFDRCSVKSLLQSHQSQKSFVSMVQVTLYPIFRRDQIESSKFPWDYDRYLIVLSRIHTQMFSQHCGTPFFMPMLQANTYGFEYIPAPNVSLRKEIYDHAHSDFV